jgi:hypothetical protein
MEFGRILFVRMFVSLFCLSFPWQLSHDQKMAAINSSAVHASVSSIVTETFLSKI